MITKLTVALKIGADTEPFSHSLGHLRTNLDGAFAIDQDLFVVGSTIKSVVQTTFRNSVPAVSAGAPFRVVHFCPG